jgi:hypothetical protein
MDVTERVLNYSYRDDDDDDDDDENTVQESLSKNATRELVLVRCTVQSDHSFSSSNSNAQATAYCF